MLDIKDILVCAEKTDLTLKLSKQLSREDYLAVNAVLERLGGKWNQRKKVHEFQYNVNLCLQNYLETGELPAKNPLAFFPTPQKIIDDLFLVYNLDSDIQYTDKCLSIIDPSAGIGNFVDKVLELNPSHNITAIELDENRYKILYNKYKNYNNIKVIHSAFEDFNNENFDIVLMNPPFSIDGNSSIWIDHLYKGISLLNDSGKLACVTPIFNHQQAKKFVNLRKDLNRIGYAKLINEHKFDKTAINTCTIFIDKDQSNEPYSGYLNISVYQIILHIDNDCKLYNESHKVRDWEEYLTRVVDSLRKENEGLVVRLDDSIINAVRNNYSEV